jgi:hypothetical protein
LNVFGIKIFLTFLPLIVLCCTSRCVLFEDFLRHSRHYRDTCVCVKIIKVTESGSEHERNLRGVLVVGCRDEGRFMGIPVLSASGVVTMNRNRRRRKAIETKSKSASCGSKDVAVTINPGRDFVWKTKRLISNRIPLYDFPL